MVELIRTSFFSGVVCCGLATLKNASFRLLPSYFTAGFLCGSIFLFFCQTLKLEFLGAFAATITVCVIVKITLRCKSHDYLFIVLPTIYCITPGGALYRLFLYVCRQNWQLAFIELVYSSKVILGCLVAILVFEKICKLVSKRAEMQHKATQIKEL
ncbi:MAG: hypothetical protein RR162_05430 [Oscillospiraceae bacterium]